MVAQVFADNPAVIERGTVIGDQGRYFAKRIIGGDTVIDPVRQEDTGIQFFNLIGNVEFVSGHHDHADER
ncbi:MAG: hypothetical protein AAFW74_10155 [Pseudomonadota bacterium]